MKNSKIRVLVVEDSLTVRRRLCEVLSADTEVEVVGEAPDGKAAIELCRALRPDVITMDMMLPIMTGLAATEFIMAHHPTPILIVSSSLNRGEVFKTYDALAAGAVDVLEKPRGDDTDLEWERRFLSSLKLVSRIRVITHLRMRLGLGAAPAAEPSATSKNGINAAKVTRRVVAIGASTGGPGAILELLRGIPDEFELPILFVLHVNEPFGRAFADWLDAQVKRPVLYAEQGERLELAAGRVLMAPPDRHLIVRDGRLELTRGPERHSCRPSVDVLFESIAQDLGGAAIGCLLTGMGRDGAAGLAAMRRAGAATIAQDEATSVVYGMPREAVLLRAAERVLPIGEIGPTIAALGAVKS